MVIKMTEKSSPSKPIEKPTTDKLVVEPTSQRDEEIDVARASEVARNWIRENVGNLNLSQFRIENIRQNGSETRYIVICSVVPDIGAERIYYLIRIDVTNGKIVPPIGQGRKNDHGQLVLEDVNVDPRWTN